MPIASGQSTLGDQDKQDILYCEMSVCSDFMLPHNHVKADPCKRCPQRIALQDPFPSRRVQLGQSYSFPGAGLTTATLKSAVPEKCCPSIHPRICNARQIGGSGLGSQRRGSGDPKLSPTECKPMCKGKGRHANRADLDRGELMVRAEQD